MKRVDPQSAIDERLLSPVRDETGSALLSVLGITTVILLVAGLVFSVSIMQHRLVGRDVDRWAARYAAEGGIHYALATLADHPDWMPPPGALSLPGGITCSLQVSAFGGFYSVRATGQSKNQSVALHAWAGGVPGVAFDNAISLGDQGAGITAAGTTVIRGDVSAGALGLETASYRGRSFRGTVQGTVKRDAHAIYPRFDSNLYARTQRALSARLHGGGRSTLGDERLGQERDGLGMGEERRESGRVVLSSSDTTRFQVPVRLLVDGDLVLMGTFRFAPGSVFAATGDIWISEDVTGRYGLFYAENRVYIRGNVELAAQVLSPRIEVEENAHLQYPSALVHVPGPAASALARGIATRRANAPGAAQPQAPADTTFIQVRGHSVVDGTVIFPASLTGDLVYGVPSITLGPDARIRGGMYSAHSAQLEGRIDGSALIQRFTFIEDGTEYVNWLKDATVDRSVRPPTYIVPVGFSDAQHLGILRLSEEENTATSSSSSP